VRFLSINLELASKELEKWLKDRRKRKSMELIVEHADKVLQVVDELLNMARASIGPEAQGIGKIYERQDQMEKDADFLRRRLMQEMARSELSPDMKKYFMELSREVDMVADYAHGAGRVLFFLPLSNLDQEIKNKIEQMCVKTRDCTLCLRDALSAILSLENKRAVELSDKVEECEREVDILYMEARKLLLDEKYSSLDPRMVVFLSELFEAIEETSDRCEDSVDHFRILLVELTKPG
jgi:predicted phosphate transport protein (TIGR00153 family)